MTGLEKLGPAIQKRRENKGISQRQMATSLGISNVHLCNVERCESLPSWSLLIAICEALGTVPSKLFREIGL